ncbi:MAG: amidohydrolase family protein [Myxococcota bacterium]|nr:amidohydrolase family protein [Myxococcota bacterium]
MAIALTEIRVWDGESDSLSKEPWTIRVEGDRIEALGPGAALCVGAERVSLPGCTALPGLLDAHVHMVLDPAVVDPLKQLAPAREKRTRDMETRAEEMLRAGITTARDLGGGEGLEIDLRDRIEAGECLGPRLLCAGQPVTSPRGHCHFWGGEASTDPEITEVVQRQLARGVDWVKVMATGGVMSPGTKPGVAQFDLRQLALIVREASAGGRSVAAHCHGTEGISLAARAGVCTVEHCSFAGSGGFGTNLEESVARELAAHGTWVSPTVNVGWGRRLRQAAEDDGSKESRAAASFVSRMQAVFAALGEAGVRWIASTDAGIPGVPHDRLVAGLQAFAKFADLQPVDVLRAATSDSADALGIGSRVGRLRPGHVADILVVEGNPLSDLGALDSPRLVVSRGRRVGSPHEAGEPGVAERRSR